MTETQGQTSHIPLYDFFAVLFEGVPQELYTTIVGFNGAAGAAFIESFTIDALQKIVECVDKHREDYKTNIYFRTSFLADRPAYRRRGDEDSTVGTNLLWLDLDIYNTHKTLSETLDALEAFTPAPTAIWFTGRGVQAAWKLVEFCEDKHAIKARNKWLEEQFHAYGSDNTSDLSRVFRVPTTINHHANPPSVAKVMQLRMDRLYTLNDFGWSSPEQFVYGEPVDEEPLPERFLERLREQSSMTYERIFSEETARHAMAPRTDGGRIDRSKNDWFICCSLTTLGYSKGHIMSVLTHPSWFSGARFRERKSYYYINLTIQKAAASVEGDPDQYFDGKRFIAERMYTAIVRSGTRFLRITGEEGTLVDGIWYYSNGVYNRNGEQYIREEVVQRLGVLWASRHAEETIKHCRADRTIATHSVFQVPVRLDAAHCFVNTRTGMVNIESGECRAHNPDDMSFMQLPVRYNPTIRSHAIQDFVAQVLPPDTINTFWEFVGYCLLMDCRYKKALYLIGIKDSGKSTLLDLIMRFLGQHNTVSVSLQDVSDKKFSGIRILNKLANVFPDLDTTTLQKSGTFKAMVAGDSISGERKFEHEVSFYPTAKHIYSANSFVPTSDYEIDAFVERFIVIQMPHVFKPTDEAKEQGVGQADTRLVDKLSTPENLSEMFNLARTGLRRLLVQDHFTESASITAAGQEFRGTLDSVFSFLLDDSVPDHSEEGYIIKTTLWQRYRAWCGDSRTPVMENKFFKRMKRLLTHPDIHMTEGTKSIIRPGETVPQDTYVYRGRRLKEHTHAESPTFLHITTRKSGMAIVRPR